MATTISRSPVANTLAAIGEGATWIDGAVRGFGAGAGNTATEVLAAVLDRLDTIPDSTSTADGHPRKNSYRQ